MRRVLVLLTVFSGLAIAGPLTSASATIDLPEFSIPTTFTVSVGKAKLETVGKSAIKCSKGAGSGELTTGHEGTVKLELLECIGPLGGKCNSLGAGEGVILEEGTIAPVFDALSPLAASVLFTLKKEVHIICKPGETLILLKGEALAAKATPTNKQATAFELTFTEAEGKQKTTEYYNEKGELVKPSNPLSASTNGGKFEATGQEGVDTLTFSQENELMIGPAYFESSTDEYPAKMTSSNSKLKILEGGKDSVTCGKAEYTSELSEASTALVIVPTYSECTAKINGVESAATVTPGTCKDEVSTAMETSEAEGEVGGLTAKTAVGPSGCGPMKIEVPEAAGCTFEIPAQSISNGTAIAPDGNKEWVKFTSELPEATVTATKCSEAKNPYHIWLIINGILHVVVEFINLHFQFYNGAGTQILTLGFTAVNQPLELKIKNPTTRWPMVSHAALITTNWTVGTLGKCYEHTFYFPQSVCAMTITSPGFKPAQGEFWLKGFIFPRGDLKLNLP